MILLLDVGNTRIKVAGLEAGTFTPLGAVGHRDVGAHKALSAVERLPGKAERILICCVAGAAVRRELESALRDRYEAEAEFITSTHECCGVTNAYPEPQRLGADRWAALIGTHARKIDIACIIDAGSALTIDGLADGRHMGGLILPGLDMMRKALHEETGDLKELSEDPLHGGTELFASDTHEAIVRGTLVAGISVINKCRRQLAQQTGRSPAMLITGGDAQRMLAHFDEPMIYAPHLTLEGLAQIAVAG